MALTLHLSTAFLEPLDWAVILVDAHTILRNSWHQHRGNQPWVFCGQGMAIPGAASVKATRSLLHREGIWAETHEKTRVGFKFVYFDCALFVCFQGCFLQRGNHPCVLSLISVFMLYGLQGRLSALLSGSQSWFPLRETPPLVSYDTRGKNWFEGVRGWVGPHLQCRPGRREVTLFIIPSALLPGFIPAAGHLHHCCGGWVGLLPSPCSRGFSLSSGHNDEWSCGPTLQDWGDKYTSFRGNKPQDIHYLGQMRWPVSYFIGYLWALFFIVGLYLVLCTYILICISLF